MRVLVLAVGMGCAGAAVTPPAVVPPEPPPPPSMSPVLLGDPWAPPTPDEVVDVPVEGGAVALRLVGIGAIHRRFFTDARLLPPLGALAACGGPHPTVWVHWDARQELGRLVLERDPTCAPSLDADGLRIDGLAPAFDAVLGWCARVAGLRDLRVAAFQVGVMARDAAGYGVLWAAGRTPEAGLRGCFEVDGERDCPGATDGLEVLPVPAARRARLTALWAP